VRWVKRFLIVGGLLFGGVLVLLQLVPIFREQDNPPVIREPEWDSPRTRELADRACYDCHSNETHWPWYSRVAPMSLLVYRDIVDGREVLNFSEWQVEERPGEDIDRMVETIQKGQMPPRHYLILNPGSRLTNLETTELVNGLIATVTGVVDGP
jgi:hypothetical protein